MMVVWRDVLEGEDGGFRGFADSKEKTMGEKIQAVKTNVMRMLEKAGVAYTPIYYDLGQEEFSGLAVSLLTGIPPEQSFKTLTAKGVKRGYLVFVLPVDAELDFKKAAQAAEDKSVEMLHLKDLQTVTGYRRGEVSPLGMTKRFPVFFDETAILYDRIAVSAGKKGASVLTDPEQLASLLEASFADLSKE